MALKNIIQLYETKVDEKEKTKVLGMQILDTPPMGFLSYQEAVKTFDPQPGDTIFALVPVKDIWGDTTYNRVERIHYGNIVNNLKKRGGFSFKSSGAVSLFARPNGRLVATKGNHRVTKRYAVSLDPEALIPAEITFHISQNYEDIIREEASDHNVDCNYRTSQNTDDRFKAAYHAGEQWAVNLYNYLNQFGIGIAETNIQAKYEASSYRSITKSQELDEEACSRYLRAFTSVVSVDELGGVATFAATCFLNYFKNAIKFIDENNLKENGQNVNSVENFLDYIYNERSNFSHGFLDTVNQAKLTEGNSKFKGEEVNVARLISLYNEYCLKVLRAKIPTNNKDAIGYSSNEYLDFIKQADETVRSRVDEVARQTV